MNEEIDQGSLEEKIMNLIKRGYNVKLSDLSEIDLGFEVEVAEKIVGKEGFNPCVPKNKGKAIYQGTIREFTGKDIHDALNKALRWTWERSQT